MSQASTATEGAAVRDRREGSVDHGDFVPRRLAELSQEEILQLAKRQPVEAWRFVRGAGYRFLIEDRNSVSVHRPPVDQAESLDEVRQAHRVARAFYKPIDALQRDEDMQEIIEYYDGRGFSIEILDYQDGGHWRFAPVDRRTGPENTDARMLSIAA